MTANPLGIRKVTKVWKTKDDRKLRICDMADEHLLNTIAMCQRKHRAAQLAMPFPQFGGEMAQWCAESDYDRFQESGPEESFPLYEDLCLEAMRRGLDMPKDWP
jgi:hypothetical protein